MARNPDLMLADDMGRFFGDPLGFVMYAYDWANDPELQLVELPEPWSLIYGCKYGPDEWACEFLDDIARQVRARGFDGANAVAPQRHAVASGHGIGKSTITAWLTCWIMSTRPFARGTVTANTADQLASKTWAEIAKWSKRCITGHWFEIGTGRGAMYMRHKDHPVKWKCEAHTCREENSEAFAGQHAATSTSFYIFDEASAVPSAIWEVAEGGFTDGEPMMFAFGNPTRNSGKFFDCFNGKMRHRWTTRQVDSRAVAITNKAQLDEWEHDYGADSDFFKVRVRGVFPSQSSMQFIGRDLVDAAGAREVHVDKRQAVAIGVDVARFGIDHSVIRTRHGHDGRSWPPIRLSGQPVNALIGRVAEHANMLSRLGLRVVIFVDGGGVGGGVVDGLRALGFTVIDVQFGSKADDPRRYANKRAEMWGLMRDWLAVGALDSKDAQLTTDLTSVEYGYANNGDAILLESKDSMRARGLASPDDGDALAVTFAQPLPVPPPHGVEPARTRTRSRVEYDPFANLV